MDGSGTEDGIQDGKRIGGKGDAIESIKALLGVSTRKVGDQPPCRPGAMLPQTERGEDADTPGAGGYKQGNKTKKQAPLCLCLCLTFSRPCKSAGFGVRPTWSEHKSGLPYSPRSPHSPRHPAARHGVYKTLL